MKKSFISYSINIINLFIPVLIIKMQGKPPNTKY